MADAAPALHHLALGARDVERVAAFYRDALGLPEVARHHEADGRLRSVWLGLRGGARLMVERSDATRARTDGVGAGLFLMALEVDVAGREALEARLAAYGAPVASRSAYSAYARDPEGNRVAISHYPHRAPAPSAD